MPFPKTLDELTAAGYVFLDHATCRSCGEDIEFWQTPRGKKMPMNPMNKGTDEAKSHFATCPDAPLFRNQR
jgi:hypothetical protein